MTETLPPDEFPDEPISVLHKYPKTRGYTQVENSTVRDPRLSFKATGLLTYLLSLPEGVPIGSRVLCRKKPDGRSAIMSGMKELRGLGYVDQRSVRREDGTFMTTTHVYEVPPGAKTEPGRDSPGSENPASENRPTSFRERPTDKDPAPVIGTIHCTACGLGGFPTLDAMTDHQEQRCEVVAAELAGEPDDLAAARERLRASGGHGG